MTLQSDLCEVFQKSYVYEHNRANEYDENRLNVQRMRNSRT